MKTAIDISTMLQGLKDAGLYRHRHKMPEPDKPLLNFSSNDYLSLATTKAIASAYQKGYQLMPSASGGSMLLGGYHGIHQELEQAFAQFLGVEDALLFSSGYAANLALMALLKKMNMHCLIDKGVHASMYDGLTLQQLSFERFQHHNYGDLKKKLDKSPAQSLVLTEGIFSMSGEISDLRAMTYLSQRPILVDEAHSFGLLGEQGRGAVSQHHLSNDAAPVRVIPLGKAFAGQGAVIAGKSEWIEGLIQFARSYIYSTAFSPAIAYGMLETLEILKASDLRRAKLQQLIDNFRQQIKGSALSFGDSRSAIQRLNLGCPHKAAYFSKRLLEEGIFCLSIRQPSVSKQETGLRIVLNYCHDAEDIRQLIKKLDEINHAYSLR